MNSDTASAEVEIVELVQQLAFHLGAFFTAVEQDLPVVPVAVRGTRSMLRDVSLFPRRGRPDVTILPPVAAASRTGPGMPVAPPGGDPR